MNQSKSINISESYLPWYMPAVFILLMFSCPSFADKEPALHATEWMSGRLGLSTHYLAHQPQELESLADHLKVEEIASQAADAGASWFLFPLSHEYWLMMAPNATLDRLLGNGDYTSERDVPLALARALGKKNVRLMLYVNLQFDPSSKMPTTVKDALGFSGAGRLNDRLVENLASIFREFSLRYGTAVSGWWVDGVQTVSLWGKLPEQDRERWFKQIAAALRAGNPKAVVAFNPGLESRRYSAQSDFAAGESADLGPIPKGRWLEGAQWHGWTYVGNMWGLGGTRFSDGQLLDYARQVSAQGGAMTFEVGTRGRSNFEVAPAEPNDGRIDPEQVKQIRSLTLGLRKSAKSSRFSSTPQPSQ